MKSPLQLQHRKSKACHAVLMVATAASSSFSEAFVPMALRNLHSTHRHPSSLSSSSSPSKSVAAFHQRFQRLQASPGVNGEEEETSSNGGPDNTKITANTARYLERFDAALKNGNLRDAEQVMRSSEILSQSLPMNEERFDLIFNAIEDRTRRAETELYPQETQMENLRHVQNLAQLAEFPDVSQSRLEMTQLYQALAQQGHLTLFGAVNAKQPVVSSIASRSLVPPELLEQTIQLPMQALTPQPTNSILFAGVALAVAEGLMSLAVPGVSLNFLVLMTLILATVDRLFLNGAVLENYVQLFAPGMSQKIARHEAGHFLAAYLLGCPVEGVVLSAWEALQDDRFGKNRARQVSAGTSFFDPQLSQQMNSGLGSSMSQQQQPRPLGVTRSSIDRYSIIVMAGIAAEADYYGRADGGAGDEMALIAFLSQLNRQSGGGGSSSSPFPPSLASLMAASSSAGPLPNQSWSPELIKNQARWGALQAVAMLREYKPAYEALVAVLEKPGPTRLCDCIRAIETAAQEHNLKPTPAALALREMEQQQQQQLQEGLVTRMTSISSTPTTIANGASSSKNAMSSSSSSSPEEIATTLQEYRSIVEKRLQEVEARLGEIQENKSL